MKKILVINGPNLNLLGVREPEIYGSVSLDRINESLLERFTGLCEIEFFQSNHEGEIIDRLHREYYQNGTSRAVGIVINAGAYTHTSLAIADALRAIDIPAVEVHLSNIHAREPERRRSYLTPACKGMITGLGPMVYTLAIEALLT